MSFSLPEVEVESVHDDEAAADDAADDTDERPADRLVPTDAPDVDEELDRVRERTGPNPGLCPRGDEPRVPRCTCACAPCSWIGEPYVFSVGIAGGCATVGGLAPVVALAPLAGCASYSPCMPAWPPPNAFEGPADNCVPGPESESGECAAKMSS